MGLLLNKPADTLPETLADCRTRDQRKVDVPSCFVPGAESSRCDVFAHALRRLPHESQFPIVNYARTIGGQVRDETDLHQPVNHAMKTILHEMRAEHQDDRGVA